MRPPIVEEGPLPLQGEANEGRSMANFTTNSRNPMEGVPSRGDRASQLAVKNFEHIQNLARWSIAFVLNKFKFFIQEDQGRAF